MDAKIQQRLDAVMGPVKKARPSRNAAEVASTSQWLLVFSALLAFRIVNALTIKSFFQPDEYFQALEPAWRITFGAQSGAWITWEWREGLRTAVHPWIFAIVYKVADVMSTLEGATRSARAEYLLIAPKIAQAIFAALLDFYTWKLSQKIYGASSAASMATLALTAFSPWQWYTSTRTFANSFETTLTVVALNLWPWDWFFGAPENTGLQTNVLDGGGSLELRDFFEGKEVKDGSKPSSSYSSQAGTRDSSQDKMPTAISSRLNAALAAAAMACILRPTNGIIWVTIAGITVSKYSNFTRSLILVRTALVVGTVILGASLLVDHSFYGKWTIPPIRFLYMNIMQDLAVFYGRNRIDYYFTEGLPLLLTTALPFAAVGTWSALRSGSDRPQFAGYVQRQTLRALALVIVTIVLSFSMIAHKEMRFIYPVLPILHVLAAKPLADFFVPFLLHRSYFRLAVLLFGLTVNVYIAAYVSTIHQRGVIDVMHYLRHEAELDNGMIRNTTVGFLMPCHSTPWRSHLIHPEINAWALTCEPPIDVPHEYRADYFDEADTFYMQPKGWIDANMADRNTILSSPARSGPVNKNDENSKRRRRLWPEYLVFFEHLEPTMNAILDDTRYDECWRGFNTHWHDDGRRRGDVVVRCLRQ